MRYLRNLVIASAIILGCCSPSSQKGWKECVQECGGWGEMLKQRDNNEWACFNDPDKDGKMAQGPCVAECLGVTPDDNRDQCMCEYCKQEYNHRLFCSAPNAFAISKEECEEFVCSGKAQFWGQSCYVSNMNQRID